MRRRLQVQLGVLGLVAGLPLAWVPALCLLPLVTAASGVALGEWLYRRAGTVSLPMAAAMGTAACAAASGVVYGAGMGLVISDQPLEAAMALAMGGVVYSFLFMPFAALLVWRICRRPFASAPPAPADQSHPYRA